MRISPDVEETFARATGEARKRTHTRVAPLHLLHGLLRDRGAVDVLRRAGAKVSGVEARVERRLADLERFPREVADEPVLSHDFQRVIAHASSEAQSSGKEALEVGDLIVGLFAEPGSEVAQLLASQGATRFDLLLLLAHGIAKNACAPAPGAVAQGYADKERVIFHNDRYTTMDFVTLALKRIFEHDDARAAAITSAIHERGSDVAGVYAPDVAQRKVAETMVLAKQNGMPLLVTSEPE